MRQLVIKSMSLFLSVAFLSCSSTKQKQAIAKEDNPLIEEMYKKDIEIRELDAKTDTVNLEEYDKVHREKIFQVLADNKVVTPKDKIKAAWILQHTAAKICDGELTSLSPENFLLAYKLSSSALSMLENRNDTATIRKQSIRRIIALNYDRYLLYTFGYQKFGTQFVFDDKTGEMLLAPINTTLASDEERKKHHVEPLSILLKKYKMKPMPEQK
jgi:hypothetical protein